MEEECRREITSPVFTNATLRDAVARFWEDKSTAESIYGPMKCWNVAEVTDMEGLFSDAGRLVGVARTSQAAFNEPIEFWVVDKVTNMKDMFKYCTNFRQSGSRPGTRGGVHEHGGHVLLRIGLQPGFGLVPAFKCRYDLGVLGHDVRVGRRRPAASTRRGLGLVPESALPDAGTDAGPFYKSRADGDALADTDAPSLVPTPRPSAVPHTNQVQGVQRRSL